MLKLTRSLHERVRIGPDVWVTITRIRRNQVQIGIVAPPEVAILREELVPEAERTPPSPMPDAT